MVRRYNFTNVKSSRVLKGSCIFCGRVTQKTFSDKDSIYPFSEAVLDNLVDPVSEKLANIVENSQPVCSPCKKTKDFGQCDTCDHCLGEDETGLFCDIPGLIIGAYQACKHYEKRKN